MVVIRSLLPIVAQQLLRSRDFIIIEAVCTKVSKKKVMWKEVVVLSIIILVVL